MRPETSAVMVIVRLGAPSPKVTDDYRGFRKGVYVRVTEGNSGLETSRPSPCLLTACRVPRCEPRRTVCSRGNGPRRGGPRKSRRINRTGDGFRLAFLSVSAPRAG